MAEYHLSEIEKACCGKLLSGKGGSIIRHLLTDSRKFFSPGDSLFFAIKGDRHDGHNYIDDLYRHHIRNFIVSSIPENMAEMPEASFMLVSDTRLALQQIAAMHRSAFNVPVIGITGSNGKTIVKEWLYQLLQKDKAVSRSPKSYNSQIGVPLSVWQLMPHHEMAIFEAGISKPGEMKNLESIIKPGYGIITNIGEAHQEHFDSMIHKLKEKLVLFRECDALVYCRDHELIDNYLCSCKEFEGIRLISWSAGKDADLIITGIRQSIDSAVITANFGDRACSVSIPFTDKASVENAVHCWCMLLALGYSDAYIAGNMKELSPVAMRMEQKKGVNNCTLINDSYNSDPGSLAIATEFLSRQAQNEKKTIILSDMFETGKKTERLNEELRGILSMSGMDRFIGIGPNMAGLRGFPGVKEEFFISTDDFIRNFNPDSFNNEAVLLKGARAFEFERISRLLEEKVHTTVMEINLSNLVHNLNYFKSLIKPGTGIMAVVKAFSYGSGSFEVARALSYNLVDYLAVAFTDEGVSLRKAGIKTPIMVMNPDPVSFSHMVDHMLEPEIFNLRGLRLFSQETEKRGIGSYPVHIKLDTGMYRLGFQRGDIKDLITELKTSENLKLKSVFSHLAASEDPSHDDFTRDQIELFRFMSEAVLSGLDYHVCRHILNSAGIERFPDAHFDMVRLGIGMYGVSAIKNNKLATVNTFKSIISHVQNVPAGHTAGYSRAFRARADSRIAIVPVGYADGLDRRLGNGVGSMLVNGAFAPVAGNICMDMCMIDITGIDAWEGDEVVLFGDELSISDIASLLNTIPYEVFTGISARVKRVYVQE